jgi:hypothetical protein
MPFWPFFLGLIAAWSVSVVLWVLILALDKSDDEMQEASKQQDPPSDA